jgi:hypothetical protein
VPPGTEVEQQINFHKLVLKVYQDIKKFNETANIAILNANITNFHRIHHKIQKEMDVNI